MPKVKSDHASIYYDVYGSGPVLAFAHGAGGNMLSWWQQVPYFVKKFTVILFDQRGFGRSTCEDDFLHPKYFVEDLRAILLAEKIERVTLICQSMGGFTGLPFTLAYPEYVQALILCGTTGGLRVPKEARTRPVDRKKMMERGPGRAVMAEDFPDREPELAFLFSMITKLNDMSMMQRLRSGMSESAVQPEALNGYNTPTLLIHGTKDALFAPEAIRAVTEIIPGATSIEMPGVGHSTYFEDAEGFNKIVEEFIG
ncbi:alpha/beta fold hydrolase [Thermodesulfobacteriota bacterium]